MVEASGKFGILHVRTYTPQVLVTRCECVWAWCLNEAQEYLRPEDPLPERGMPAFLREQNAAYLITEA